MAVSQDGSALAIHVQDNTGTDYYPTESYLLIVRTSDGGYLRNFMQMFHGSEHTAFS